MTLSDLISLPQGFNAIIIGANGGIGAALADALEHHPRCGMVLRLSRQPAPSAPHHHYIDLDDDASITAAAEFAATMGTYHLIINATGRLHSPTLTPEKTYRHLSADALMASYRANCIGPVMAAQAFLPLLAKGEKSIYGILSARVGSIHDNRIGGWHGYRAAKAALNMMIRNLAIETALKSPHAVVIGLHPGTVETNLSQPFRSNVKHDIFTPQVAAEYLLNVMDRATTHESGTQLAWDGTVIPG